MKFSFVLSEFFVVNEIYVFLLLLDQAQEEQDLHFLFEYLFILKSFHFVHEAFRNRINLISSDPWMF